MNLSITNWNINRIAPLSLQASMLHSFFDQFRADIIVLTETHQEFFPCKGYYGVHSGTPDYTHSDGERMCSIWTNTPLESLNKYLTDPARCTAGRTLLTDNRSIVICAIVLPWLGDTWQGYSSKSGQAFKKALDIYRKDWNKLRKQFPEDDFILVGDFNQDLISEHYYGSKDQKTMLRDVLLSDGLVPLTADGNDPVYRDSPPHACIDHICISTQSQFILKSVERWPDTPEPDIALSDHFAITTKLKITS